MRCPYCGGPNADHASFCTRCGRDLTSYPPPNQYPPIQGRPTNIPPPQHPIQQTPVTQRRRVPTTPSQSTQTTKQPESSMIQSALPAPESPSKFPPGTVEQLKALEQGALAFTVIQSAVGDGRKKIVRIVYPKCVAWQQVATLLKALKEQLEDLFDSIIIQGVLEQDPQVYAFTNGQLVFDRGVRLGSLTVNRYQIETGNGFETDSVRIVLTE